MSKLEFESLRHEISHVVHGSRTALSAKQLLPMCDLAEDETQLANALYNMSQADQLIRLQAPAGTGRGAKWCYGPGKVKLGALREIPAEPENDAGGGDRTARPPREKAVVHKNMHKVHKTPSKAASKRAKPKAAKRRDSSLLAPHASPATAARWALTSDGAFVDLSLERGSHEIPRERARALIEFVRRLDRAEV